MIRQKDGHAIGDAHAPTWSYFTGIQTKDCQTSGGVYTQVFQSIFASGGGVKLRPSMRSGVINVNSMGHVVEQAAPPSVWTTCTFVLPTYLSPSFLVSVRENTPNFADASG